MVISGTPLGQSDRQYPLEMERLRIDHMVDHASVGHGVQIVDDTGFAKKGTHSVGVARQYSGTLGRVDNCQVLVTTHYVDLPQAWTKDRARRVSAKVPAEVGFQTKGEIALQLIDAGVDAGVPTQAVVADASARKTSIDAASQVTEALIRKLQACDFQFPC